MSDPNHCKWYGIECDLEGHVEDIKLARNNVTRKFPTNLLSQLHRLKNLNLAENHLTGIMTGAVEIENRDPDSDAEDNGSGTAKNQTKRDVAMVAHSSLFFNLRELTHVDLSCNNLKGELDILFAPALLYANFSHNNFTSVKRYKTFKRSHKTLQICDMSHSSKTRALLFAGKPAFRNVSQVCRKSEPFETVAHRLQYAFRGIAGLIFIFPKFAGLRLLKSEACLIGPLPESLSYLYFTITLDLSGNSLTGSIPLVLGTLSQLKNWTSR